MSGQAHNAYLKPVPVYLLAAGAALPRMPWQTAGTRSPAASVLLAMPFRICMQLNFHLVIRGPQPEGLVQPDASRRLCVLCSCGRGINWQIEDHRCQIRYLGAPATVP